MLCSLIREVRLGAILTSGLPVMSVFSGISFFPAPSLQLRENLGPGQPWTPSPPSSPPRAAHSLQTFAQCPLWPRAVEVDRGITISKGLFCGRGGHPELAGSGLHFSASLPSFVSTSATPGSRGFPGREPSSPRLGLERRLPGGQALLPQGAGWARGSLSPRLSL